jgi:hypothetical protein
LRWLLPLEEYGITSEYLPGKLQENVDALADDSSHLDFYSLKIQEE